MNYSDVTHDKFRTRRHVDPLDPVYIIKYKEYDFTYLVAMRYTGG
jgi:hypothetical protein